MLLYHYAKEPYEQLKTKQQQGNLTLKEIEEGERIAAFRSDIGPYYNHISFFFEPAPLDILGTLFAKIHHDFWIPDSTIYEHVVESKTLGEFGWWITETAADIEQMYKDWPIDAVFTDAQKKAYFHKRLLRKEKAHEVGYGNHDFEQAAKPYIGGMRKAYIEANKLYDDDSKMQYAAYVPHAMLYPESGIAELKHPAKAVKIGGRHAKYNLEEWQTHIPASMKW